MPRMTGWLIVSLVLFAIQYLTMPTDPMDASRWARALVVVNKINLLTVGAWLGYMVDRRAFPYARPDSIQKEAAKECHGPDIKAMYFQAFSTAMIRRAIIMGSTVMAVALGV